MILFRLKEVASWVLLKRKTTSLGQLITDWETDYKDAAYLYKKAHIEVEVGRAVLNNIRLWLIDGQTTKAAVEDLGRYGGALDK